MLVRFFSDWEKDWNLSSFIFRVSRWSLLVGQFTFLVLLILVTFSVFKVKNKCNVKYWNIWYYIVLQFLLNGIKLFWFSTCMSPLAWWSLLGASNQIQTCLNAWIEMTYVWNGCSRKTKHVLYIQTKNQGQDFQHTWMPGQKLMKINKI